MPRTESLRNSSSVINKITIALFFCLAVSSAFALQVQSTKALEKQQSVIEREIAATNKPPYIPVYRIPLRVHLGKTARGPQDFVEILDEINDIWWSQAGICFEFDVVKYDEQLDKGIDVWFMPALREFSRINGYYRGDHEIYVRDTPILGPAAHPANSPTARTTAHELGHALGLHHRQDSDDNLMRSKTFGWHLNQREIALARKAAFRKAFPDTKPLRCGAPVITFN